ncbi:TPA: hypothetical protein NV714_001734 [Escherichia coli]|nr:hypothetical protein [Escherichia coli]
MNYFDKLINIFKPKNIEFYKDEIDKLYYTDDKKIGKVLSSLIKNKNINFSLKFEIISERYLTKYLMMSDLKSFVEELINNTNISEHKKNMYLPRLFELEHYHLHHLLKNKVFNDYEFQDTVNQFLSLPKDKKEKYADYITNIIVDNKETFKFNVDPSDPRKDSNTAPLVFVTYYLVNKNYSQAVKILKNYRNFVADPNINKFSDFRNTSHYLYQNEFFLDGKLLREINKQECLFLLADEQLEFRNRVGNIYGALCECYFKSKTSRTLSSEELNTYLITVESMIQKYESKHNIKNEKYYRFQDILTPLKVSGNFNSHAVNFIDLIIDKKINIGDSIYEIFHNMITKNRLNMDFKNTLYFITRFAHNGLGFLSKEDQYLLYLNAYENSDFTNSKEKKELENTMVNLFHWTPEQFSQIRYHMDNNDTINKEYYSEISNFKERINNNLFFHFKDDQITYSNDIALSFFFNSVFRDIHYSYSTEDILDGISYLYKELNKLDLQNDDIHFHFIESLNNKMTDEEFTFITILNDSQLSLDKFKEFYKNISLDIFKKYPLTNNINISFVDIIKQCPEQENLNIKISHIENELISKEFEKISAKQKFRL